jgi:hypothetical protein
VKERAAHLALLSINNYFDLTKTIKSGRGDWHPGRE